MFGSAVTQFDEAKGTSDKKSEMAYRRIRQSIVDYQMPPGSFIDKTEICKTLHVSRQPVTLALSRLEREGLVEILPQRGSYVSRLSLSGIVEHLTIRAALEGFAARELATHPRADVISELKSILVQEQAAQAVSGNAYAIEMDMKFHRTIASSATLPKLLELVEVGLATMRRTSFVIVQEPQMAEKRLEHHQTLVAAIEAGDADKASAIVHEHVATFLKIVETQAARRPEIFLP